MWWLQKGGPSKKATDYHPGRTITRTQSHGTSVLDFQPLDCEKLNNCVSAMCLVLAALVNDPYGLTQTLDKQRQYRNKPAVNQQNTQVWILAPASTHLGLLIFIPSPTDGDNYQELYLCHTTSFSPWPFIPWTDIFLHFRDEKTEALVKGI